MEQAYRLTGKSFTGQVALRPESVTFCRADQGIKAEILSYSLLGNVIRYRVRAMDVELLVDVLNRSPDDLHPRRIPGWPVVKYINAA